MNTLRFTTAALLVLMFSHASIAGCPGCPEDADPNDEKVKNHAQKSIAVIQEKTNSPYKLELIKIESVTTQVVAGELLKYKLIVGHEDPVSKKQVKQRCTVEVWLKPWENFEETKVKGCEDIKE